MSKKKTARPSASQTTTKTTSTLPALYSADQEALEEMQERVRYVRALQSHYAAAIIAGGVFGSIDGWSSIVDTLAEAEPDTAASLQALTQLFDRLEKASPNSTQIAWSMPTDPASTTIAAVDLLTLHACGWGEVGFLLGLATGMQLGPHAFDGVK